jgi:hypothetical protein
MDEIAHRFSVRDRGPSPFDRPITSSRPRIPILVFLDRVFLWLPNDSEPGFWAVCLVLLRQAILPWVVMLTPVVGVALAKPGLFDRLRQRPIPGWAGLAFAALIFGSIALIEELSRYAFVRRAEQPRRAIIIFTAALVAGELLIFHDRLYTIAWISAAEILASVALYAALQRRLRPLIIVPAIIVVHTAIYVIAPQVLSASPVPGVHR